MFSAILILNRKTSEMWPQDLVHVYICTLADSVMFEEYSVFIFC